MRQAGPSVCPPVRNAFLKYALQIIGLSRYVSLGQLGSVRVSLGEVGPSGGQHPECFSQIRFSSQMAVSLC
jgi:hypothetical protein